MKYSVVILVILVLALVPSGSFGLNFGKKHQSSTVWRPSPFKQDFMGYINSILNNPKFNKLPTQQKLNIFVEIYNKMDKFNLRN